MAGAKSVAVGSGVSVGMGVGKSVGGGVSTGIAATGWLAGEVVSEIVPGGSSGEERLGSGVGVSEGVEDRLATAGDTVSKTGLGATPRVS